MKTKSAGWVLAAVVSAVVCACGSGKQEAAVALDEARLSVSSARKAGAESSAPTPLAQAVTALTAAEADFKTRKYPEAQTSAQKARDAARLALAQAVKVPKHSPKPEKIPKTAKAKVKK